MTRCPPTPPPDILSEPPAMGGFGLVRPDVIVSVGMSGACAFVSLTQSFFSNTFIGSTDGPSPRPSGRNPTPTQVYPACFPFSRLLAFLLFILPFLRPLASLVTLILQFKLSFLSRLTLDLLRFPSGRSPPRPDSGVAGGARRVPRPLCALLWASLGGSPSVFPEEFSLGVLSVLSFRVSL